jgi:hypothetical protein
LFGNVIVDLSVDDSKDDYQTCDIVDGEEFCYNSVFSDGGDVLVIHYTDDGWSSPATFGSMGDDNPFTSNNTSGGAGTGTSGSGGDNYEPPVRIGEEAECRCKMICPDCGGCTDATVPEGCEPCSCLLEKIANIIYCSMVGMDFLEKVNNIANDLDIDPDYLMAAMAFETGNTFSSSIENPYSCAVGLIQFTPIVCQELGTTMDDLRSMSEVEQLDYVYTYFELQESRRGDIKTLEDVYMAILCPVAIGKPSSYTLYEKPSIAYTQNKGLDFNNDGKITKSEASKKVIDRFNDGTNERCTN